MQSRKLWQCCAVEQRGLIRTDAEPLGVGPRDVPEGQDRRARQAAAQHLRHQREVIVLHEHDRIVAVHFGDHRVGEALVDLLILQPVAAAEDRVRMRLMAERPQRFVREAVVVALLFLLGEPHAPQQIARFGRRDRDAPVAIRRRPIRRSAAVGHPDARTRPHHRLEGRDEPACRVTHDDVLAGPLVDDRLAVRNDDHALTMELGAQHLAKPLRRPRTRRRHLIGLERFEDGQPRRPHRARSQRGHGGADRGHRRGGDLHYLIGSSPHG
jgi:hypothetical protein